MQVEVRQRADGWRTMLLVGGDTRRQIMHGVAKMDQDGRLEPRAMPTEYLKTMAAVALSALERAALLDPTTPTADPPRLLFLGLGAGALPKLLAHHLPGAHIVAIECDGAVCDAAEAHMGLDRQRIHVERADALHWVHERAATAAPDGTGQFDAIFVDIFDERNECPPALYGAPFLAALTALMSERGVIVHNLHAGSRALNEAVDTAYAGYARAFGAEQCCRLRSLDSKPWAGNAILGASRARPAEREPSNAAPAPAPFFASQGIAEAARASQERWGIAFDLATRCQAEERPTTPTPPLAPPPPPPLSPPPPPSPPLPSPGHSMVRSRPLSLLAAALVAVAATAAPDLAAATAVADGFDEAVKLCPDERVVCVSSYDERHFVEPWEYDGTREEAVRRVADAVARLGGVIERDDSSARGTALRVAFPAARDTAIFWFPVDDFLVQFRSERTDGSLWDGAANKLRLDQLRKSLGYAPAPMVKNRYYLPGEQRPDGTIKLEEERPYRRRDGRFYGSQGGDDADGRAAGSGLTSIGSPEALRRLLFPFGRLGGRSSPAQALYDDLSDLGGLVRPASVSEKLYDRSK